MHQCTVHVASTIQSLDLRQNPKVLLVLYIVGDLIEVFVLNQNDNNPHTTTDHKFLQGIYNTKIFTIWPSSTHLIFIFHKGTPDHQEHINCSKCT
ncbi:unnamed protein product [Trifolium pratense]|uniref:Uncharacterized protein n=1 Tax=Trifolium pratense TaxID=57577 RepID=A0ACB0J8C5_TRIPR|nr:unnamed protein product [Trifolium pratense]